MDVTAIIGIGLVAAVICMLLRQYKAEYALFVSLAAGIVMLLLLLRDIEPILSDVRRMLSSGLMEADYAEVLLKAQGICFLTQIACDTCRDAGESAMSVKIEMAGKLAVLAASLPLFRQVLNFVTVLMRY